MASPSWAPVNETASEIWEEKTILDGLFLGAIAYGVHLTLFIWTFQLLWQRKRTGQETFFLVYITIVFVLSNIGNGTSIKFGEMTFIDDRNYPGGPSVYNVVESSNSVAALCNTAYFANSWFQDGLLVYRLWIIGQKSVYITILPVLMFLASVTLSLALIIELWRPGVTLYSKIGIRIAVPYISISIALNIIITTAIVVLLLNKRRHIQGAILDGGGDYVTITAMLVESAALFTVNGLCFLVSFAVNSPVQNLFFPTLGQTQSIAPLLIILRVTQGRAWSTETMINRNIGPQRFDLQSKTPMQFNIGGATTASSIDNLAAVEKEGVKIYRTTESHDV